MRDTVTGLACLEDRKVINESQNEKIRQDELSVTKYPIGYFRGSNAFVEAPVVPQVCVYGIEPLKYAVFFALALFSQLFPPIPSLSLHASVSTSLEHLAVPRSSSPSRELSYDIVLSITIFSPLLSNLATFLAPLPQL